VETEYLLEIVRELNFIDVAEYKRLEQLRAEVGLMLNAFAKSIKGARARSLEGPNAKVSESLTL
jgi:hypothetical protein